MLSCPWPLAHLSFQSSVAVVDGRYVSMYKEHVIRNISEQEYRMFPNLWTRVMSAWMAMMAVFCSKSILEVKSRRQGSVGVIKVALR